MTSEEIDKHHRNNRQKHEEQCETMEEITEDHQEIDETIQATLTYIEKPNGPSWGSVFWTKHAKPY